MTETPPPTEPTAVDAAPPPSPAPRRFDALRSRPRPWLLGGAVAVVAVAIVALVVVGGTITDPREIVRRGYEASSQAGSFHLAVAVEGTVTDPESGMTVPLDGVTMNGDFDVRGRAWHISFAVPMLLGMTGEMIVVGDDAYLKTSLSGADWLHTPFTAGNEPMPTPNPSAAAQQLEKLLAQEGVVVEKLADEPCGETTCYHVRLTVPVDALTAVAHGAEGGLADVEGLFSEEMFGGPLELDQLYDRGSLLLREMSMTISPEDAGDIGLRFTFSDYDVPVAISPPPSDQISEEGEFPLFPY